MESMHCPSCTLVVMDITGFTRLSTKMRADELVAAPPISLIGSPYAE